MKVFICGIDGYLGWSLACHLAERGHEVGGLDNLRRRAWVEEVGANSGVPIQGLTARILYLSQKHEWPENNIRFADMTKYNEVEYALSTFKPDSIVHLAEQPSAPYSMRGAAQSVETQHNNVIGSLNLLWAMREHCPEAHLLKLGTMGEYGTPPVPIPEGFFGRDAAIVNVKGQALPGLSLEGMPFPRSPGSFYHASKVHDSVNVDLACRMWGLRSTDIMQGVVYGTTLPQFAEDERLWTRFDFDETFGTAINRFCAQAVCDLPITPYGSGTQKRGFLPLEDSMQCLTLALENPPLAGEYRVFNQFEGVYSINDLAYTVLAEAEAMGIKGVVQNVANPRTEMEDHFYEPAHRHLLDLGYVPNHNLSGVVGQMLHALRPHRDRMLDYADAIQPRTLWTPTQS